LVSFDAEIVLRHELDVVRGGGADVLEVFGGELELDGSGRRKVGAHFGGVKVKLVVEDAHVDVVVEAVGGCAVHHAVLAVEARGTVLVDDELEGLVEPAVATVTVPVLASALVESDGCCIVETDNERGGLNLLEGSFIGRVGLDQTFARVGPVVTVLRGQDTDGRALLSGCVDSAELLLELSNIKLTAVDLVWKLVERVLADDQDVGVLLVVVSAATAAAKVERRIE
jgi:hypothetical protein